MTELPEREVETTLARRPADIRWWPALLIIVVAGIALAVVWNTSLVRDVRQSRVLNSIYILAISGALLIAWLVLASRLSGRVRLGMAILVALFGAILPASVRIEGVTGDVRPILAFRWSHRAPGRTEDESLPSKDVDLNTTTPQDFPQFLGPNRRGTLEDVALDPDWEAHPPKLIWQREIGEGWGSFAIVGPYAVTQEQHGTNEEIVCYEVATGTPCWRYAYPAEFREVIAGDGPRATPTVVDGRVYAVGATGVLTCLDGRRGELVWSTNILDDAKSENLRWGKSCSPLVLGELVIVNAGGQDDWSLVAYDKRDGHVIWHGGKAVAAYNSPMLATLDGVPQILILSMEAVIAHDPADGHELWRYPWGEGSNNIAQPIVIAENRLFLSSGYGYGCILLEVKRDASGNFAAQPVWNRNRNMKFKFTNGVVDNGFVYGLDDGVLCCLDLATGKRRWRATGRYGHGQVLLVRDLLLVLGETGELYLVRLNPEKLEELGQIAALSSKTWNNPALSGSFLLVRNDREAACYKMSLAK